MGGAEACDGARHSTAGQFQLGVQRIGKVSLIAKSSRDVAPDYGSDRDSAAHVDSPSRERARSRVLLNINDEDARPGVIARNQGVHMMRGIVSDCYVLLGRIG